MFDVHEFIAERLTKNYVCNFFDWLAHLWLQSLGTRDTDKQAQFTNEGLIASVYEGLASNFYRVLRLYVYRSGKSGHVPSLNSSVLWHSNILLGVI
jgi:hypothetical protein